MRAHRSLSATAAVVTLAFLTMLSTGTHTVARGETLAAIASRYGTTASALAQANGIANPNRIYVGARLSIPGSGGGSPSAAAPGTTYTIKRGDTLGSIASRHHTSISALVQANAITNPNRIRIGMVLTVPAAGTSAPAAGGTSAPVGGARHHIVAAGDTIGRVASRYGISQTQLVDVNGLTNGRIYVGQRLDLVPATATPSTPTPTTGTHTVASGQTLSSVARKYGTTIRALIDANAISNPNSLRIGQVLQIPSTAGGSANVRCPVEGGAKFMNDWGFPRTAGRFHEGNDLFAPRGTPAVAVVTGTVVQTVGKLGGNQVKLAGDDGVSYYYTHLDRFGNAGRVNAGDVVGFVGSSGNAAGSATHLHFEVHPGGGAAVNPYPRFAGVC